MDSDQSGGHLKLHVTPEYDANDRSVVTGIYLLLDGFIIKDKKMEYKAYTLLLKLTEEGPLVTSIDKSITVGDEISLYVELHDIEYYIWFIVTAEMVDFCEEWKNKNFTITYWDNSPRYPTFSVN